MRLEMSRQLDPKCPQAKKLMNQRDSGFEDPMTAHYGAYDVIAEQYQEISLKHLKTCTRCQEYSASTIAIIEVD